MDDDLVRGLRGLLPPDGKPSAEDVADLLWVARFAVGGTAAGGTDTAPAGPPGPAAAGSPSGRPPDGEPSGPRRPAPGRDVPRHAGDGAFLHTTASAAPPGGRSRSRPAPGGAPGREAGDEGAAVPAALIRVRGAGALPAPLDLSRALRPLRKRAPGPGPQRLDERATEQATGETGLLTPVWAPRGERLFSADLVIDTGPSMPVWSRLAAELRGLLETHGAFRAVRAWSLDTGAPLPRLAPFRHHRPAAPARTVPPRHLSGAPGTGPLLLLTDGVGPQWHAPELPAVLQRWSRTRPVAVLQVLPSALWHRTAVVPSAVLGSPAAPGRPVPRMVPRTPVRAPGLPGGERWVPVLELAPDWLGPWAALVAGEGGGPVPLLAFRPGADRPADNVTPPGHGPEPGGAALVERFRGEASPGAFELAGYLAAVPLVLPVMRLVQRAMMPGSGTAHLAEVFLSGLLVPVPATAGEPRPADPELVLYDFPPGVREALLTTLTRSESLRALDVVGRITGTVAARFGGSLDFRALLTAPGLPGAWHLPPDSRPFARVATAVLAGLGGSHAAMAAAIAARTAAPAADPPRTEPAADPSPRDTAPASPAAPEPAAVPERAPEPAPAPAPEERAEPGAEPAPGPSAAPEGDPDPEAAAEPEPALEPEPAPEPAPLRLPPPMSTPRVRYGSRESAEDDISRLATAATVRVHGKEGEMLGSGFFVAPGWVLTCAHVALAGREEPVAAPAQVWIGHGDRLLRGVVEWAEPDTDAGTGRWPAPDLALVRLTDEADHPCVWLTERATQAYSTNLVAYFGWVPMDGEVYSYSGRCTISGHLGAGGGGMLRLGNEDEVPAGLAGGPVVDMVRGEVIGVLKSRRSGQVGGLAVGIQQLRHLPVSSVPEDDLYQRVLTAHDRYHGSQYALPSGDEATWADAQTGTGALDDRALTAGQRVRLLGLLAELPPPPSVNSLLSTVAEVRGSSRRDPSPAPRAWRDGLGLLYDLRRGTTELEAVLRYAVHAATAERSYPAPEADERALWGWAQETAAGSGTLTRGFRNSLMEERRGRLRVRAPLPATRPPVARPRAEALLEIIPRGWEPGRYDWRVCVMHPQGDVDGVEEDFQGTAFGHLPGRLAEPLREAFRRCDEPGHTATLQVAVRAGLTGLPVDEWRLRSDDPLLGAARPVVFRRGDPAADAPDIAAERHARWTTLNRQPPRPLVLDGYGDDVRPDLLAHPAGVRDLPYDVIPVLCGSGGDGGAALLSQLLAGTFPVILWCRHRVPAVAWAAYSRGVGRLVRDARSPAGLPAALTALRASVAEGVPETYWSAGLSLLYDDPTRPLPESDDLLEMP